MIFQESENVELKEMVVPDLVACADGFCPTIADT